MDINNKEFLAKKSLLSMAAIHTKVNPQTKKAQVRISDCNRTIILHNDISDFKGRKEMHEKIDTLIRHLSEFKARIMEDYG